MPGMAVSASDDRCVRTGRVAQRQPDPGQRDQAGDERRPVDQPATPLDARCRLSRGRCQLVALVEHDRGPDLRHACERGRRRARLGFQPAVGVQRRPQPALRSLDGTEIEPDAQQHEPLVGVRPLGEDRGHLPFRIGQLPGEPVDLGQVVARHGPQQGVGLTRTGQRSAGERGLTL
jgi:hypothetical protein